MTSSIRYQTQPLPISHAARQTAQAFAQQLEGAKRQQIYLNTLAVLAVHDYLKLLGIATDLESSDSWQPMERFLGDIADLNIPDLGQLECRPMQADEQVCSVPPEVWSDQCQRIGYAVIQFDRDYLRGTLLGFVPAVSQAFIALDQLQPVEALIDHLFALQPVPVQLTEWLQGKFENAWKSLEDFFSTSHTIPALAFRGKEVRGMKFENPEDLKRFLHQLQPTNLPADPQEVAEALAEIIQTTEDEETRWTVAEVLWTLIPNHPATGIQKIMDLGMKLEGCSVALMVSLLPRASQIGILLRVYPMGTQSVLPEGLELACLDENNTMVDKVEAKREDNYIQLKLKAKMGDWFKAKILFGNHSIVETFAI